jgi:hypothetical protein
MVSPRKGVVMAAGSIMAKCGRLRVLILAGMFLLTVVSFNMGTTGFTTAEPLDSAFTYQGRLVEQGFQADGDYDFEFILFADSTSDTPVDTYYVYSAEVDSGLFTCKLAFDSLAFVGEKRWLEIHVRPSDQPNGYTQLLPRHELTPAPYSVVSQGVRISGEKPIFVQRYGQFKAPVRHDTGYSTEEWTCGIFGFYCGRGNVAASIENPIIEAFMHDYNGQWRLVVNFCTEGGDDDDWNVNVICIRNELVDWRGGFPGDLTIPD